MNELKIIISGVLFFSALYNFMVAIYAYRKKVRITIYFALLSLCLTIYSLGYVLELTSSTFQGKIVWNLVQYIGLPWIPAIWIMFSFEFVNKPLRPRTILLLLVIPVTTIFFRYTSSMNHLYYLSVQMMSNHYFSVLVIQKGPWYWLNWIFQTASMITANYLYFTMHKKSSGTIRRQSQLMFIASILPWISGILDLFNLGPFGVDYGPLAITSSVVIFMIAFMRYQFLDIKPLARDKVFESTVDGIIVLDNHYNIIDYNPSAARIFSVLEKKAIGKSVQEIFPRYEKVLDSILHQVETHWIPDGSVGSYKVNTVRIAENDDRVLGRLVTLVDITKYMDMMEQLNSLASRDGLTNVFNRRQFLELSSRELEMAKQARQPLSVIILDLDFFKNVNDTFGHQAGDKVLIKAADVCKKSIRDHDILARYGGEEFVILLPQTTVEEGLAVAEKILLNIEAEEIVHENHQIKVTASMGIAGVAAVTDENLDYFLSCADKALYTAKSEGRNCIRMQINE